MLSWWGLEVGRWRWKWKWEDSKANSAQQLHWWGPALSKMELSLDTYLNLVPLLGEG